MVRSVGKPSMQTQFDNVDWAPTLNLRTVECIVPGCETERGKSRMYVIPTSPDQNKFSKIVCETRNRRRQLWLSNIGCPERVGKASICQYHFVKGIML
jgi:THAP domain